MMERYYLVEETHLEHGQTEVWAKSKAEALAKVEAARGTKDAYKWYFSPGHQVGPTTAKLDRDREGKPITRPASP